ncbi:hypothetical protein As57867_011820, partial [Aphanomyces stellatus]
MSISADGFLADGSDAFHATVGHALETSLGKALPQVEIRFEDLSITALLTVASKEGANELPTLLNHAKKTFLGLCRSKHSVTKTIVQPITGALTPGAMTLILGQPSSGKSSFMKALAGIFPTSKSVKINGAITYNGKTGPELHKRLPQFVSYTAQRDHHFHTLTVQETLEFAHQCCGGIVPPHVLAALTHGTPDENAEAKQIIEALYAVYPDVVVKQLGLNNCKNTIIGNAMLRGVSGGERKRVTVGEMEFGMKQVSLLDEISTGLDSAAAFDIVKAQQSATRHLKKTIAIALLQPAPEVFDLFDDVMIFNEGYVLYHGPRAAALDYFASLGFVCPPHRDVADFLLDLGTPQQDQYVVASTMSPPRLPSEYAALFQQSAIYNAMVSHVQSPMKESLVADTTNYMASTPQFHNSFAASVKFLIKRQLMVILRNRPFIISRIAMTLMMALLYSSSFYQMDPEMSQVVYGVIFQSLLFFIVAQIPILPSVMEHREIFYKQRDANFYSTVSYVLAHSVSMVPFAVVETIVFGNIMYWMAGFVNDSAAYWMYMLILFVMHFLFSAWFFFLGSVAPNLHVAKPMAMVSVLMFVLFGGFIIVKKDMSDWLVWIYWINPLSWVLRSLSINQYMAPEFQVAIYNNRDYSKVMPGAKTMGEVQLMMFDLDTDRAWIGYGILYLAGCYILFNTLSCIVLEVHRHGHEGHAAVSMSSSSTSTSSSATNSTDKMVTDDAIPNDDVDDAVYVEVPPTPQEGKGNNDLEVRSAVQPITLAFQNLGYSVPNPKKGEADLQLLTGVSGFALPGTITALMGSTGAGKTTLMDVIAGRKTGGKVVGDILLNGYQASDLAIRRCTGYCEQMDIHSESATFREALTFSAMLRQSSDVSTEAKLAFVEECLSMLELTSLGDTIVRG